MKHIIIAFTLCLWGLSCKKRTVKEEATSYYQQFHNDPAVELCKGLSILKRGDQHIVFADSLGSIILKNNQFQTENRSLDSGLKARVLAVIHFMEYAKIARVQANFKDKSQIELRVTEDLVLVKSGNLNYCKDHVQQKIDCDQINADWFYYIKRID